MPGRDRRGAAVDKGPQKGYFRGLPFKGGGPWLAAKQPTSLAIRRLGCGRLQRPKLADELLIVRAKQIHIGLLHLRRDTFGRPQVEDRIPFPPRTSYMPNRTTATK